MEKEFVILRKCFEYDYNVKPYYECIKNAYNTEMEAYEKLQQEVTKEIQILNSNRNQKDFREDYDGDYDCIIRFWDGDDYRIVTIYHIIEVTKE